jgi:hypothetical protein
MLGALIVVTCRRTRKTVRRALVTPLRRLAIRGCTLTVLEGSSLVRKSRESVALKRSRVFASSQPRWGMLHWASSSYVALLPPR